MDTIRIASAEVNIQTIGSGGKEGKGAKRDVRRFPKIVRVRRRDFRGLVSTTAVADERSVM